MTEILVAQEVEWPNVKRGYDVGRGFPSTRVMSHMTEIIVKIVMRLVAFLRTVPKFTVLSVHSTEKRVFNADLH